MKIGVVFPQTEIGADRGAIREYAERVEHLGYAHILAYDHVLGADPEVHQALARTVRRRYDLPRAVRAVRLSRRDHFTRARHRHHHPPAAPDRARREAGRRGGSPHERPVPARRRPRLERRGVRGAGHELLRPRPAHGRAGRADAQSVDPTIGHTRRRVRARHRRRARPAPDPAAHPDLVRCRVGARLPPHREACRRMVPAGAARSRARRGTRGRGGLGRAPPAGIRARWAWKGV